MIYYPDTTLPPTESAQESTAAHQRECSPRSGGARFWRKGERLTELVGFNGLSWNIVVLNQPNANLMPISQKHKASHVNSANEPKIPQMTQKTAVLSPLKESRPCQRSRKSPAYMTLVTRTHAIPHNARCTPHITHPHVTQCNPCGTNLYHLHKSLDGSCYGLGSDLN